MTKTIEAPKQDKLIDVETSEAAREAERYSEIRDDIDTKKQELLRQGEKVVEAMRRGKQKVLTYTDQYGYKRTFSIIEGVTKLRYSKREEA